MVDESLNLLNAINKLVWQNPNNFNATSQSLGRHQQQNVFGIRTNSEKRLIKHPKLPEYDSNQDLNYLLSEQKDSKAQQMLEDFLNK